MGELQIRMRAGLARIVDSEEVATAGMKNQRRCVWVVVAVAGRRTIACWQYCILKHVEHLDI
jgi:hypothetical protein